MTEEKTRPLVIRIFDGLGELSGYLSGIAILVSTLIIVHQVSVRYFLGVPAVWQMETSIYLLIFTAFVGAAYGLKHDAHVGIDFLVMKLIPRTRKFIRIITSVLCVGLTAIVGWKAWILWWEATESGWQAETLLSTPLTIPYFILPLGMTLIVFQFIVIIYDDWVWIKNNKKYLTYETEESKDSESGINSIKF